MGETEHQFHAGLFGQYGSALPDQTGQSGENSSDVTSDAPKTVEPKPNTEEKSASDGTV
jgi:hypothetical protein